MDFLSKTYQKIKIGIASLGGIGSVVCIIAGVVVTHGALGVVLIAGGSVWFATSGFVLFDSIKVHSLIRKDVDRLKKLTGDFKSENLNLKTNVGDLKKTRDKFEHQNVRLHKNIDKASCQITALSSLKQSYEKNLRGNNRHMKALENKVVQLDKLKYELTQNLQDLATSLDLANEELLTMEKLKNDYTLENKKLQAANQESAATVKVLQQEVGKLKALYIGTKKLLAQLATAGDMFSEFSNTIGTTAHDLNDTKQGYDDTLEKMESLLEHLKDRSFKDLDGDADGTITEQEFRRFVDK